MGPRTVIDKAVHRLVHNYHRISSALAKLTAMDIRHIEHSEECEDAVSESFFAGFPKSRSRLWVVTLAKSQQQVSD